MKKALSSMIKKAKKGESSFRCSHHSDEGSHERREDEGESHAQMVPYATPLRTREPKSGLLLNHDKLHKYISIRAREFVHTSIIDRPSRQRRYRCGTQYCL